MYKIINTPRGDIVVRSVDFAAIPSDPANSDYQRFLEWVAAGGIPEPWEG